MKKIILLMILLSSFALAQQMPEEEITTTFQANQLGQIFEYRQEGIGSLQLYKSIRGREVNLGSVSGTIVAEPPLSLRIRNAHYSLVNSRINIAIVGDLIITKSTDSNKPYPLITLLDGISKTKNMIFLCGNECRTIEIDGNSGQMKLDGKATILRDSIDYYDGDRIIARNILIEPQPTDIAFRQGLVYNKPKEVQTRINLRFSIPESTGEEEHYISRFKLAEESEGSYFTNLREELTDYPPGSMIIQETIGGKIHILDQQKSRNVQLKHDGVNEIVVDIESKELFKIKEGDITYNEYSEQILPLPECLKERSIRGDIEVPCFSFNTDTKVAKLILSNSIININLDQETISNLKILNIGRFLEQNHDITDRTKLIVKKTGIGKMIFTKEEVILDNNWQDFGISFSTFLYRPQSEENTPGTYDFLECRLEENKCFINGREITIGRNTNEIRTRCETNDDCGDYTCVSNRCIQARECRMAGNNQNVNTNNIDVLFVGSGIESFDELERISDDLLNGPGGLFSTEPFKDYKEIFNIWLQTAPKGIAINELDSCPNANYKIILSRDDIRSRASDRIRECRIFIHDNELMVRRIFVHEFGHCFGGLADEYKGLPSVSNRVQSYIPNCLRPTQQTEDLWAILLSKEQDVSFNEAKIEARELMENAKQNFRGCGSCRGETCNQYVRPSLLSIMKDPFNSDKFNKISRIYLEEKLRSYAFFEEILGQPQDLMALRRLIQLSQTDGGRQ